MQLLPVHTSRLRRGGSLTELLLPTAEIRRDDILVISSKVVATAEDAWIDLAPITPSAQAITWAKETGSRSPSFIQAVLDETARMRGTIVGSCPGALLTEVRPEGLAKGSILTANAGLDESNVEKGYAVGWPLHPLSSAQQLRADIERITAKRIAVIITDSCCRPRRLGVTAFALTVAGIDPLASQIGREDLFGKTLHITTEAVADQLATAANALMGNAGQSIPAVLIRDHGIPSSEFAGWVDGIEPEDDLFRGII